MAKIKIAITMDEALLTQVDELVARGLFGNRSQAIETAVRDRVDRERRGRLARESAKLDPVEEKRFADEGLADSVEQWPEY